jgi:hypothetical protein
VIASAANVTDPTKARHVDEARLDNRALNILRVNLDAHCGPQLLRN